MRKTGKTTRLVDKAIQSLFTNGEICIPNSKDSARLIEVNGEVFTDGSQRNFREIVINRLLLEHKGQFIVDGSIIRLIK